MILALAAVASLLLSLPSHAQTSGTNTVSRNGYYFNQTTGQRTTVDGVILDTEVSPASAMVLIQPSWITTRFVYGADGVSTGWTSPKCLTVDSTSVPAQTLGYNRLALLIYPQFEDSVGAALFAIQVRGHQNSATDSLSTFAFGLTHSALAAAQSAPDTINSFLDMQVPKIQFGSSGLDTARTTPGERLLLMSPNINTQSGILVMLKDRDGTFLNAPYVSIRWRIMNTYGANLTSWTHTDGTATGVAAFGQAIKRTNLTAAGQTGGDTRFVILRADLVGWRE